MCGTVVLCSKVREYHCYSITRSLYLIYIYIYICRRQSMIYRHSTRSFKACRPPSSKGVFLAQIVNIDRELSACSWPLLPTLTYLFLPVCALPVQNLWRCQHVHHIDVSTRRGRSCDFCPYPNILSLHLTIPIMISILIARHLYAGVAQVFFDSINTVDVKGHLKRPQTGPIKAARRVRCNLPF